MLRAVVLRPLYRADDYTYVLIYTLILSKYSLCCDTVILLVLYYNLQSVLMVSCVPRQFLLITRDTLTSCWLRAGLVRVLLAAHPMG